jgi:hypothetical protein
VEHLRLAPSRPHARELFDPGKRVDRVPAEKVLGPVDRPA